MHSLAITALPPLRLGQDATGAHVRQSMFLRALASVSGRLDILGFAIEADVAAFPPSQDLDDGQSRHWGCPASIELLPIARRRETFWSHYAAGVASMSAQPSFYHYAGPVQQDAVARRLAARPGAVFVFGMTAMLAVLGTGLRPENLFFDLNDVEHKVRLRTALARPLWPGKAVYGAHVPAIVLAERRAARLSRATFVCSDVDAAHLRRLGFGAGVRVAPNALAMPERAPGLVEAPSLMFIGSYGYQPNREAAARLLSRIWPLVRSKLPSARLIIAGRGGDQLPGVAGADGVEATGFVDDVGALYARSRVVTCPISTGGGTRIKLIEAASYARPAVSTRLGAEGLDFADGADILLRDDDAGFAAACVELLQDDARCIALGASARRMAAQKYDVARVEAEVARVFRSAARP